MNPQIISLQFEFRNSKAKWKNILLNDAKLNGATLGLSLVYDEVLSGKQTIM